MGTTRSETLTAELASHFPLREIDIAVGGRSYRLTTAEDIELLIGRITEEEFRKDERLPYWAELWHSAVALAEAIAHDPTLVAGRRVLEVGCGLALPAVVAASHGGQVTCGDFEPLALKAAELNLLQNAAFESADVRLMDFREPPREQWPLILAADVIYEKRFIEPLADFLVRALEPGGTVLLAEPNRLIAVPFFDALTARGFSYTRTSRFAALHGRTVEISLYEITKKKPRNHENTKKDTKDF